MNIIRKLLGGRPMKYQETYFIDRCTGLDVNHYIDTLGRHWLACSRWAIFYRERMNAD